MDTVNLEKPPLRRRVSPTAEFDPNVARITIATNKSHAYVLWPQLVTFWVQAGKQSIQTGS